MKLRRFFGPTSRAVLEQVRAELGPDAMIVANHASADGIEITALPATALPEILDEGARTAVPVPPPVSLPTADDEGVRVMLSSRGKTPPPADTAPPARAKHAIPGIASATPAPTSRLPEQDPPPADRMEAHDAPLPAAPPIALADTARFSADMGERVMAEMAAMRALLQEQMAQLAWSDALRRSPLRARLTRDLLLAGYSAALARTLTERLPDDFNANEAQGWLAGVLARNVAAIEPADELVTRGGIYALIGPTGVGKTTTTAKLAARCAVRYGAGKLALLTTDSYRVGAQDQLRIYAKILGVAVHTVSDRHDLRQALESVRGRHLVLIDTVGIGQRDSRVAEQAQLLDHPDVSRVLLLNAAAQAETLEEVVTTYRRAADGTPTGLCGAIITKLDEAARTGGVLDVAIRHRLTLQYVTNGQRVPEDLAVAHARYLVDRSLRAALRPTAFAIEPDEVALIASAGAFHA
jgi:flagellar biosynthesis protein FlhF